MVWWSQVQVGSDLNPIVTRSRQNFSLSHRQHHNERDNYRISHTLAVLTLSLAQRDSAAIIAFLDAILKKVSRHLENDCTLAFLFSDEALLKHCKIAERCRGRRTRNIQTSSTVSYEILLLVVIISQYSCCSLDAVKQRNKTSVLNLLLGKL